LTISAIEARDEKLLDGVKPRESKIVTGASSHGGILFYFGRARNKRVATLFSLFGALCLGAGLLFGIAGGQTFGWIIGAIPITFSGGIGILLLAFAVRSEEHTSELQSRFDLVCRLLLEKKKKCILYIVLHSNTT